MTHEKSLLMTECECYTTFKAAAQSPGYRVAAFLQTTVTSKVELGISSSDYTTKGFKYITQTEKCSVWLSCGVL